MQQRTGYLFAGWFTEEDVIITSNKHQQSHTLRTLDSKQLHNRRVLARLNNQLIKYMFFVVHLLLILLNDKVAGVTVFQDHDQKAT